MKKALRTTSDGLPLQSFDALLADLGTRCRNRCRVRSEAEAPAFDQLTAATPLQQRALKLLESV